MKCDDALNLLSSNLDAELPGAERVALDEHLTACPACRESADALALQNANLTRAFAPHRRSAFAVAERVIAQLPTSNRVTAQRSFWNRISPLLAAAAGFAIALMVFRPWNDSNVPKNIGSVPTTGPTAQPAPIAQLALATGLVEFRCPGADWRPLETGGPVPAGTDVRTGPKVRCEFKMTDGSEVRLNTESEAKLQGPRKIEVA